MSQSIPEHNRIVSGPAHAAREMYNHAVAMAVQLGGGTAARAAMARALRAARQLRRDDVARELRTRVQYITGHLFKD